MESDILRLKRLRPKASLLQLQVQICHFRNRNNNCTNTNNDKRAYLASLLFELNLSWEETWHILAHYFWTSMLWKNMNQVAAVQEVASIVHNERMPHLCIRSQPSSLFQIPSTLVRAQQLVFLNDMTPTKCRKFNCQFFHDQCSDVQWTYWRLVKLVKALEGRQQLRLFASLLHLLRWSLGTVGTALLKSYDSRNSLDWTGLGLSNIHHLALASAVRVGKIFSEKQTNTCSLCYIAHANKRETCKTNIPRLYGSAYVYITSVEIHPHM